MILASLAGHRQSSEGTQEYSPRRKPWVNMQPNPAPEERKKMSHTCGNVLLHLIFSTHQRRPLIQPEIRSELFAYLGGIVRELNGTALIAMERRTLCTCWFESGQHRHRQK
jgi:hypothetical protein